MRGFFKNIRLTLFLGLFGVWGMAATAYGYVWNENDHVVINHGEVVDAERLYTESSMVLENYGTVMGDIYACPGCDLQILGMGRFDGRVYSGDGGTVTRVITGGGDFTPIDVEGNYNVLGYGEIDASLGDMLAASVGADKIILRDARLKWSHAVVNDLPPVELQGVIILDVAGSELPQSAVLLSNVQGDGRIVLAGVAPDALYAPWIEINDGELLLHSVRETDYNKILDSDVGDFLNAMQEINPNDSTLLALDSASSMDEINYIMRHSNILNPMNLMGPISVLNTVIADDISSDCAGDYGGFKLCGGAGVMLASQFSMSLANIGLVAKIGHALKLGLAFYGAKLDMTGDAFGDADVYGLNMRAEYAGDRIIVRALGGRTYSEFTVPYVFDAGRIATDPRGVSDYGVADIGWQFRTIANVGIVPFAGAWYQRMQILSDKMSDVLPRAGLDVLWRTGADGLFYDYKLRGTCRTDGMRMLQASVGFLSAMDGAGADASVAVTKHDDVTAFYISLQAKIRF